MSRPGAVSNHARPTPAAPSPPTPPPSPPSSGTTSGSGRPVWNALSGTRSRRSCPAGSWTSDHARPGPSPASPSPPPRTGPATPEPSPASPLPARRSSCSPRHRPPATAPWPAEPADAARSATATRPATHLVDRPTLPKLPLVSSRTKPIAEPAHYFGDTPLATRSRQYCPPGLSVQAGGGDGPHRHVHSVVLQQRSNDAEPILQRPHPILFRLHLLPESRLGTQRHHLGHKRHRLRAEDAHVGRRTHKVDAPPARAEHPLEIVGRQAVKLHTVDVVATKLQHKQPRTGFGGPVQRPRILRLGLLVIHKHVIERAVDDGVEPALKSLQLRRVGHLEVHLHPSPLGVTLGQLDRRR